MAKNDIILVDGIVDQRLAEKLPSDQRDEVFEYLVLEEVLKDYDLAPEELEAGWIDGNGDGGIDGFYILINGHLLDDAEDFAWPRANAALDLWVFTCKHHATFQQAPLDALLATIQELFDFSLEDSDLKGVYSEDLLASRGLLLAAYRRLSISRPTIKVNVVYASRGDSAKVGESVAARSKQIESTLENFFSSSTVDFRFLGASEIVDSHRKVRTLSLHLPFLEHLATGKESYVLLVKLHDYWKFVSDENGNLRRYLFDSNVRDFLGANSVNEDIARSLEDPNAPDFWWLNNGVTILATNATVPGKIIQLQDIQIVNGLQTTETIFKHFKEGSKISADRALLVKIIVTTDAVARDRIIRATNNQSPVEIAALRATDKIQRDIEEVLEQHDWYYERRKNYYKNIGKPQARFVHPAYVASAVVALVFKNVPAATRIKTRFMRDQLSYDEVFSAELPLELWPVMVGVYKRVETALVAFVDKNNRRERLIANWRPLVSLLVVSRRLGTFAYNPAELATLDPAGISDTEIQDILDIISHVPSGVSRFTKVPPQTVEQCCASLSARYGTTGIEVVGRRKLRKSLDTRELTKTMPVLPHGLLEAVDALLPKQPWKPKIHEVIARQLGRAPREVSLAIQALIAAGKRNQQRNGVVYDEDGNVIATDPERVGANAAKFATALAPAPTSASLSSNPGQVS